MQQHTRKVGGKIAAANNRETEKEGRCNWQGRLLEGDRNERFSEKKWKEATTQPAPQGKSLSRGVLQAGG